MRQYPKHWWADDKDSKPVFHWEERTAWCANCGTVSTDARCHCTDPVLAPAHKPDWRPFDRACFDEIKRLKAELELARKIIKLTAEYGAFPSIVNDTARAFLDKGKE